MSKYDINFLGMTYQAANLTCVYEYTECLSAKTAWFMM